jgi:single-strand DNA-binding protein
MDDHHQPPQEEEHAMSAFDINQLTISGNLTHDPELRLVQGDRAVCSIRIAHNERRKSSSGEWTDQPAYFDVTIWNSLGEWVAENLDKGQKVVIAGRLRWREYKVNDSKRQAVDITADSIIPVPRNDSAPVAFASAAADDEIAF